MLSNYFNILGGDLLNPASRLYLPTLLFTLLFVVLLAFIAKIKKNKMSLSPYFSRKIWFHPSSKMDLQIFLFNNLLRFVAFTFISGALYSSYDLSIWFLDGLNYAFGHDFKGLGGSQIVQKTAFTFISFVTLDFFRFFQHYCMHKVPFLWRYHKIHHSAEVLTPLSVNRVHPFEMFLGITRTTIAISFSTAIFIYLFRVPVTGLEILGVNTFGFLFNLLGSNLRHSHFWFSFGCFEKIFISPAQHQIHHSLDQKHFDKNFGVSLSCWDLIFGSFMQASSLPPKNLQFGVHNMKVHNLWKMIRP